MNILKYMNNKIKICFIAPKAYPIFNPKINSTFGGAEVQLYLLATEIAKKDNYDVHFIVADYGQQYKEKIYNVNIWKSLDFKTNIIKQSYKFFQIFNKINADIYIQRTLTIQSSMIALYCKLRKKKFVYMVAHDRETDNTHELYKNKIKKIFANLVFKYAHKIIAQNEYQKSYLMKKKIDKNKLYLLKKGVDFRKIYNETKQIYDAIWVGRCEKWKQPEIFLELAKKNPNQKFIMICPQATNKKEYFKKIKNEVKDIKNMKFIDFIKNDKIYKKLSESKIFVFTSEKEGDWPMVVLEACASKLPILSYGLNYTYLIDQYKGGFVCKNDFNLLDKKFIEMINNINILEKMGNNAYEYVKKYHNIKTNINKFLEIITK